MTDRGIAIAQIALSIIFLAGYFWLMYQFIAGHIRVPADYKDMFTALLGVLTAGVGTILSFWFSRSRPTQE